MREAFAFSALAVALLCSSAVAQSNVTDFSGRWVLTGFRPEPDLPDTLDIQPADELMIVQTLHAITIAHPSKKGTHPEARTFEFGTGGRVGGVPGAGRTTESRWGVTFFGAMLTVSESTTSRSADGQRTTSAYGSIWLLDTSGRLIIKFREERSKERPKIATRVYVRKQ